MAKKLKVNLKNLQLTQVFSAKSETADESEKKAEKKEPKAVAPASAKTSSKAPSKVTAPKAAPVEEAAEGVKEVKRIRAKKKSDFEKKAEDATAIEATSKEVSNEPMVTSPAIKEAKEEKKESSKLDSIQASLFKDDISPLEPISSPETKASTSFASLSTESQDAPASIEKTLFKAEPITETTTPREETRAMPEITTPPPVSTPPSSYPRREPQREFREREPYSRDGQHKKPQGTGYNSSYNTRGNSYPQRPSDRPYQERSSDSRDHRGPSRPGQYPSSQSTRPAHPSSSQTPRSGQPSSQTPRTGQPPSPGSFERPPYQSGSRFQDSRYGNDKYPRDRPVSTEPRVKLGPTGKHVRDLTPPPRPKPPERTGQDREGGFRSGGQGFAGARGPRTGPGARPFGSRGIDPRRAATTSLPPTKDNRHVNKRKDEPGADTEEAKRASAKAKDFHDIKPKRPGTSGPRHLNVHDSLSELGEEGGRWRKKRSQHKGHHQETAPVIRPTQLKVRLPILLKDLAAELKVKASEIISYLFMQGAVVTLNSILEDETTVQLIGEEFKCHITIDTAEEEKIKITNKNIKQEIAAVDPSKLILRAPVVAFMGHVDHGKTSLIDAIRKSEIAEHEAGQITQHIGAFLCHTPVGPITILDTPGHEAFAAMRSRGAEVTDIVVLVIAGDDGMKQQTIEAMQQAKDAGVTIVVAINKCDKPTFNAENVYRQLSEHDLLPEAWGGSTVTANCSATTGQGIPELLELLALQAEVLELKADPTARARGTVIESEMHKGLGPVATLLVQNGTLRKGDALVFGALFARVKTMMDDSGKELEIAPPSTPVKITGISGLPEAGDEFIAVKNEKEAREIAEARAQALRESVAGLKRRPSLENLLQAGQDTAQKKILHVILKADVQGSLEALKHALTKIHSNKVSINILSSNVGEISESDVELAKTSKATLIGFHTAIESHAEDLIKQAGLTVRLHDIIYHAVDDVKELMKGLLDKIAQESDTGTAEVRAIFKSSHLGIIAGCHIIDGHIARSNHVRLKRGNEIVWKGKIASLKREKEDVREVKKGFDCGIILENFTAVQKDDIIEAFEVTYLTQDL